MVSPQTYTGKHHSCRSNHRNSWKDNGHLGVRLVVHTRSTLLCWDLYNNNMNHGKLQGKKKGKQIIVRFYIHLVSSSRQHSTKHSLYQLNLVLGYNRKQNLESWITKGNYYFLVLALHAGTETGLDLDQRIWICQITCSVHKRVSDLCDI